MQKVENFVRLALQTASQLLTLFGVHKRKISPVQIMQVGETISSMKQAL